MQDYFNIVRMVDSKQWLDKLRGIKQRELNKWKFRLKKGKN